MPSFGDIKDRASKFKDTSVNKVKDTRDRYQSTSSKNLDWDPNHKPPPPAPISRAVSNKPAYVPPPPPSRTGQPSVPTGSRPPVIRRDTRPDQVPTLNVTPSPPLPPARTPSAASISSSVGIDWSNLSERDKETLFSWLDEYFARRFNVHTQPGQ
ncbi:hypothetical protein QCA50_020065 [Cerrena zonata]|uniref:Uncharacterized protein n=1 Tax=Cerrena zonata TaxID=2478898 RepID=A0AAW0FID3_9APHY